MKTKVIVLLAGVALLAACKGKSGYETADNNKIADTLGLSADSLGGTKKLVKTAGMSFKVKNVQKTEDTIAAITISYNGMVMHHQMTSDIADSQDIRMSDDSLMRISALKTTADMTIRVPSDKLETIMNQISHLGLYITSRQMDIDDKSFDYLSAKLKVGTRKDLLDQQNKGKVAAKTAEGALLLKDGLIDGQIEKQKIDQAVKYSTVSLNFYQSNIIVKEMIANDNPSAYQPPFFKRLALAIINGWVIFTDIIIGLVNLWVLILTGIGLWILFRLYKKKRLVLKS